MSFLKELEYLFLSLSFPSVHLCARFFIKHLYSNCELNLVKSTVDVQMLKKNSQLLVVWLQYFYQYCSMWAWPSTGIISRLYSCFSFRDIPHLPLHPHCPLCTGLLYVCCISPWSSVNQQTISRGVPPMSLVKVREPHCGGVILEKRKSQYYDYVGEVWKCRMTITSWNAIL